MRDREWELGMESVVRVGGWRGQTPEGGRQAKEQHF